MVVPRSPFISSFKRLKTKVDLLPERVKQYRYNLYSFNMSFPTKSERSKCWTSRDELWKCLDENPNNHEVCSKFRALYESSCPSQWVKHFDRKREYLKFKDRIQNEGSSNLPVDAILMESSGQDTGNLLTTTTAPRSGSTSPNARVFRKFQPPTYN